jgi:uncharacterized protein YabN with tetrapyrrole methylase and pyrophosphatase domain
VIDKLTRVGFQWSDLHGPLEKVKEEFAELSAEIQTDPKSAKVSHELGDLLFSICNLAAMLKLNPEDSLRSTLDRVQKRFRHVEKRLKDQGKNPEQSTLAEMDSLWNEAKALLD